jgi:hypothetical protein
MEKEVYYMAGVVIALIGVIYGIVWSKIGSNAKEIKRLDEDTDKRLDDIEKDIIRIETRIK